MRLVWPIISLKQAQWPIFLLYFFETAIGKEHLRKYFLKNWSLIFFFGVILTNTGLNKAYVLLCICFFIFRASILVFAFGIIASPASWSSNGVCVPVNLWSASLLQIFYNHCPQGFTLTRDKPSSSSPLDFTQYHLKYLVGFTRQPSSSLALSSLEFALPTLVIHPCMDAQLHYLALSKTSGFSQVQGQLTLKTCLSPLCQQSFDTLFECCILPCRLIQSAASLFL